MNQGWEQVLGTNTKDGTALTNTTTATSILPGDTAKAVIPAQDAWGPGKLYRVRAFGRLSSAAATPGNLTLDIRFGSVIVATSQALALATSLANNTWRLEWDLYVRTIGNGTTATIMHSGQVIGVTAAAGLNQIPATAPAVGTGFDSTSSQTVDLFATFSVANASNSITLHGFSIESLN